MSRAPGTVALVVALLATACHKRPPRTVAEVRTDRESAVTRDAEAAPAQARPRPATPPPSTAEETRIRTALARGHEQLGRLEGLDLTPAQRLNAESAEGFLSMAERALDEQDLLRATTLSDKALILLQALASALAAPE